MEWNISDSTGSTFGCLSTGAAKVETTMHCVARAREEYEALHTSEEKRLRLDAAAMNVIRACAAALGLAGMLARERGLPLSNDPRELLEILERHCAIDPGLFRQMRRIMAFCDASLHNDAWPAPKSLDSLITEDLDGLLRFAEAVRPHLNEEH